MTCHFLLSLFQVRRKNKISQFHRQHHSGPKPQRQSRIFGEMGKLLIKMPSERNIKKLESKGKSLKSGIVFINDTNKKVSNVEREETDEVQSSIFQ